MQTRSTKLACDRMPRPPRGLWLTVGAMFLHSWLPVAIAAQGDAPATKAPGVFMRADLDARDPAGAIESFRNLARRRTLTFDELVDMGTARFLMGEWDKASQAYESASAQSTDRGQKAMALYFAAQSTANKGDWREAGQLANRAHQLAPNSRELAAVRVAFWKNTNDRMEISAAEDRLKVMELSVEGNPVCEPGTILVISIVALAAVTVTTSICYTKLVLADHKTEAETILNLARPMLSLGLLIKTSPIGG